MASDGVVVEVQARPVFDVGGVVENERAITESGNHLFCEVKRVHLVELDPARMSSDLLDPRDQVGLVKSRIYTPFGGLIQATDHATPKDAGAVRAVEEESREPEFSKSNRLLPAVDPALSSPRCNVHVHVPNPATQPIVVVEDRVPKRVHGACEVVDVNRRCVFAEQESERDCRAARVGLGVGDIRKAILRE